MVWYLKVVIYIFSPNPESLSVPMWTFEIEGKGRRSTIQKAKNDTEEYGLADIVQCGDFIGAILAFKQGESEHSHRVQLLRLLYKDNELLATSVIHWHEIDVLEQKLNKAELQIIRGIDHHRHHKDKIETLPRLPSLDTVEDLKLLSQTVHDMFAKPSTPRKRKSPEKPRSRASTILIDTGDSENDAESSGGDEEAEMVPMRKRKPVKRKQDQLALQMAAASLDSPQSSPQKPREPLKSIFDIKEEDNDSDEEETKPVGGSESPIEVPIDPMGVTKRIPLTETSVVNSSLVDRAIAELHPASDPVSHLCRDTQFDQLFLALESAIAAKTGTCVYVSGTPGTGKTSIIREVIAQLDLRVRENELNPFTFLEINGMKLVHPNSAYEHLWEVLDRGQMAASNAMTALEAAFTKNEPLSRRGVIVLLLDEMDELVTKGQQLMYNFFNWPSLPHSRLVVIAVANTMDLPERILSNKISSRVGLTRIQFPGYTHSELKQIIMQRLEPDFTGLIDDEAIEYATRKVAGVGGDARRALEFLRQALISVASAETPGLPVKTAHVRDVIVGSQNPPIATFIKTLSVATKVLLCAILARIRRTGNIEAPLHEVLKQAAQFVKSASRSDVMTPLLYPGRTARLAYFQNSIMELVESGLLVQQAIKGEATPRVRLMVPVASIKEHLELDPDVKGMI